MTPRHADFAYALLTHPDATTEDLLIGLRGIAQDVPMAQLAQAWNDLPPACQHAAPFAVVFASRLIHEQRFDDAQTVLLATPQSSQPHELQHTLARLWIERNRPGDDVNAQRWIADTLATKPHRLDDCLNLLEQIPVTSMRPELLAPVIETLDTPGAVDSPRVSLMITRLNYAFNLPGRGKIISDAIARWKDRDPKHVARLLVDLGLHEQLLDSMPADLVESHSALFPCYWQSMVHCGRWLEATRMLRRYGSCLPKYEELAYQAVLAKRSQGPGMHAPIWRAALADAKLSPDGSAFLLLNRIALEANMKEQSQRTMIEAILCRRGPLPWFDDLAPLLESLERQGQETTILAICSVYLPFEPQNPQLVKQYGYLACLNELDDSGTVLKELAVLAKKHPRDPTVQSVLATVLLCDGQFDLAAATFDKLVARSADVAPELQAAHITALVMACRMAKDDPRVIGFPWASLRASERRKFQEMISQAG